MLFGMEGDQPVRHPESAGMLQTRAILHGVDHRLLSLNNVPFWYRFAWFLGRPPPLTTHQWKLLGLVAAVSFFEMYDLYLFSLNLKHIQRDLGIAEEDLGFLGAMVRVGSLFAVLLTIAADRYGRRLLLLITVVGYTIFTGLTAFAPNTELFVTFQFMARAFAGAETLLAAVVIAEEFAPEHRGWGIGALGALQACGAGFAALMFAFVDVLPYGWRALYVIGLIPLLLIAYWRRSLPETHRYQQIEHVREPLLKPMMELFTTRPKRTYGLLVVVFGIALAGGSTGFFAPKYLQEVHGWSPANVAAFTVLGGMLAVVSNPLAGWMSDRFGRKPITMIFTAGYALMGIAFYSMTGGFVPVFWIFMIFFVMGSDVTLTSYGTELFPTRYRSTASGFRGLVSTVAAIVGLSAVSGLYTVFGSNWAAVSALCVMALVAPLMVWWLLPETAGRKLEEISPD